MPAKPCSLHREPKSPTLTSTGAGVEEANPDWVSEQLVAFLGLVEGGSLGALGHQDPAPEYWASAAG